MQSQPGSAQSQGEFVSDVYVAPGFINEGILPAELGMGADRWYGGLKVLSVAETEQGRKKLDIQIIFGEPGVTDIDAMPIDVILETHGYSDFVCAKVEEVLAPALMENLLAQQWLHKISFQDMLSTAAQVNHFVDQAIATGRDPRSLRLGIQK